MSNQEASWGGKRGFVRINVSLPVRCKRIKEEELSEKQEELALRPANPEGIGRNSSWINDRRRDNTDSDRDFNLLSLQVLWDIAQKLDRVIDILAHKEGQDTEKWEAKSLDLSASGLRIISPREINVYEYLQLEMNIPLFPPAAIVCIGEITWVKKIEDRSMVRWMAGLKFVGINGYDREEIIRFIFQQQRMLLRARAPHEYPVWQLIFFVLPCLGSLLFPPLLLL